MVPRPNSETTRYRADSLKSVLRDGTVDDVPEGRDVVQRRSSSPSSRAAAASRSSSSSTARAATANSTGTRLAADRNLPRELPSPTNRPQLKSDGVILGVSSPEALKGDAYCDPGINIADGVSGPDFSNCDPEAKFMKKPYVPVRKSFELSWNTVFISRSTSPVLNISIHQAPTTNVYLGATSFVLTLS